jgi:hypothetical protein
MTPSSNELRSSKPALRNTVVMRWLDGSTVAVNELIPARRAPPPGTPAARGDAPTPVAVVHEEGDLRF